MDKCLAEFDYLCVDSFLKSPVDARSLATAFETGFIDLLIGEQATRIEVVQKRLGIDSLGLDLLVRLLSDNNIVVISGNDALRLSPEFHHALQYRDLLHAKLHMLHLSGLDLFDHFTTLICAPDRFLRDSRFTRLFCYERSTEYNEQNYELTKQWVNLTTALTKYEAGVVLLNYDFSRHARMLDIGGNSGEFALQACRKHSNLIATVADRPVVCEIGRQHIARQPEAERMTFVMVDALKDELPGGMDLITFKSMLHDWPDSMARLLIENAARALKSGGVMLIFERGPVHRSDRPIPFSLVPTLLFFRWLRTTALYEQQLKSLGFDAIEIRTIQLETAFHLITAVKSR